jgi:hypothetical protein
MTQPYDRAPVACQVNSELCLIFLVASGAEGMYRSFFLSSDPIQFGVPEESHILTMMHDGHLYGGRGEDFAFRQPAAERQLNLFVND